jgi:phosphatidylserine decarboxylase
MRDLVVKSLKNQLMGLVVPQLPKKYMSHVVGSFAYRSMPAPLSKLSIQAFAQLFSIDSAEAELPMEEYKSVGEFFSRRLRKGARPIEGERVHPCDSRITQSGKIVDGVIIQAKGIKYTLEEFLPQTPWVENLEGGVFTTYYLAPKDYHRVHSPIKGKIQWVKYFPGELWPVNHWSLRNIPGVLAINERVAIGIETAQGKVVLVMVGATNVGSMSFAFDKSIVTNQYPFKNRRLLIEYPSALSINTGEELGAFNLGSTVVLLTENKVAWPASEAGRVKMGQKV